VRPFAEFGDCKILSITCHNSVKGRDIVVELASWFYASQYDKQGYGSLYIYVLVLKQLTSRFRETNYSIVQAFRIVTGSCLRLFKTKHIQTRLLVLVIYNACIYP